MKVLIKQQYQASILEDLILTNIFQYIKYSDDIDYHLLISNPQIILSIKSSHNIFWDISQVDLTEYDEVIEIELLTDPRKSLDDHLWSYFPSYRANKMYRLARNSFFSPVIEGNIYKTVSKNFSDLRKAADGRKIIGIQADIQSRSLTFTEEQLTSGELARALTTPNSDIMEPYFRDWSRIGLEIYQDHIVVAIGLESRPTYAEVTNPLVFMTVCGYLSHLDMFVGSNGSLTAIASSYGVPTISDVSKTIASYGDHGVIEENKGLSPDDIWLTSIDVDHLTGQPMPNENNVRFSPFISDDEVIEVIRKMANSTASRE